MIKNFVIFIILISKFNFKKAKDAEISDILLITIDFGSIKKSFKLGLFKETPKTSNNFKYLCSGDETGIPKDDIIDKTTKRALINSIFHRVITDFMVQGGDFTNSDGTGGRSMYGNQFDDENFDIEHELGVVSMANSGPNTNGSQFFITTDNTPWLDGKHTVFGRVLKNFDVIDKMNFYSSSSGEPKKIMKISDCKVIKE